MGTDDLKLGENLGKAAVGKKIRNAIENEYNKKQTKGIFTQLVRDGKSAKLQKNNRALFGDDTFDRLGVPHEIVEETEKEELEM